MLDVIPLVFIWMVLKPLTRLKLIPEPVKCWKITSVPIIYPPIGYNAVTTYQSIVISNKMFYFRPPLGAVSTTSNPLVSISIWGASAPPCPPAPPTTPSITSIPSTTQHPHSTTHHPHSTTHHPHSTTHHPQAPPTTPTAPPTTPTTPPATVPTNIIDICETLINEKKVSLIVIKAPVNYNLSDLVAKLPTKTVLTHKIIRGNHHSYNVVFIWGWDQVKEGNVIPWSDRGAEPPLNPPSPQGSGTQKILIPFFHYLSYPTTHNFNRIKQIKDDRLHYTRAWSVQWRS